MTDTNNATNNGTNNATANTDAKAKTTNLTTQQNKLMLLEDDAVFARTLCRQLTQKGYQCEHLLEPTQIVAKSAQFQPDIILLDMNLGESSCLPYIGDLRQQHPHAKIIIVTGYASITTTVTAIKSGADNYLPKPINLSSLLDLIQTPADAHATNNLANPSANHTISAGGNNQTQNKLVSNHKPQTAEVADTEPTKPQNNQRLSPDRLEWEYIQNVLADNQGNISETARQLNMHRRTLQRKLAKKPSGIYT